MSNSYKYPVYKEVKKCKKFFKRLASKKARKYSGLHGKTNNHKKCFESWDICDFNFEADDKEIAKRK